MFLCGSDANTGVAIAVLTQLLMLNMHINTVAPSQLNVQLKHKCNLQFCHCDALSVQKSQKR